MALILLTKLDNSRLLVNLDNVKYIEATPDTLVTFINGDSVIVRDHLDDIDRRVLEYKVRTLQLAQTPAPASTPA